MLENKAINPISHFKKDSKFLNTFQIPLRMILVSFYYTNTKASLVCSIADRDINILLLLYHTADITLWTL